MKRHIHKITPKFVEFIPADGNELVPGVVYISMTHNTVVHRCPCGCGGLSEFTLDPIRFHIKYDGEYVSFEPSIGNSNLSCRSHYWIRENKVYWCTPMEDWQSAQARSRELYRALDVRKNKKYEELTGVSRFWERISRWWKRKIK